jgi:hypothetical protein
MDKLTKTMTKKRLAKQIRTLRKQRDSAEIGGFLLLLMGLFAGVFYGYMIGAP